MKPGLAWEAGMGLGKQPSRITVTRAATWALGEGRTTSRLHLRAVASGTATHCAALVGHPAFRGDALLKASGRESSFPALGDAERTNRIMPTEHFVFLGI